MNKVVMSALAALAVSAAPAFAADMPVKALKAPVAEPSPWDVAFGAGFTSNYELRGISQSDKKPSGYGYMELDYTATNWVKFYVGAEALTLSAFDANAEIDLDGGARFSWGNFGLDVGYVYYYYPDGNKIPGGYDSFGDGYIKPSYKVADWLTVAGVFDYGNNFNNGYGIVGSKVDYYYAGNATITLPWAPLGVAISLNPELGHQYLGCTGCTSDNYWDVGLDFVYKIYTLDLRYWDTNKHGVFLAPAAFGGNDLAGSTFVATFKIDTTFSALK